MKNLFLFLIYSFLFISCTSTEESIKQEQSKEEVYVFDDVNKVDTTKVIADSKKESISDTKIEKTAPVIPNVVNMFAIQFGAYSTKDRAEQFVKENQLKTSVVMTISINTITKLFVIQSPAYTTKEEADKVRDALRNMPAFKDSFTKVIDK